MKQGMIWSVCILKRPLVLQCQEEMKRAEAGSENTTQGSVAPGQMNDNRGLGKAGGSGDGEKKTALRHISDVSVTGLNNGLDTGLKERRGMSQELCLGVWLEPQNEGLRSEEHTSEL